MEGLFFLKHVQRRIPGLEIEARLKRDDILGTCGFTESALNAQAFGKA